MSVARASFLPAMRGVAHSVAVVTTDGTSGRHGATVTSFCSASADPRSVLVCLQAASRIARTVTGNRVFRINVLREGASALADRFAGRIDLTDRFVGVGLLAGGLPLLATAVAAFRSRLIDSVDAGSHVIIVGHVLEVHAAAEPPLAYLDGRHVSLARHPMPSGVETPPCPSSV